MTLTLAAWLHTLDPFLVRISDTFGIRWYGLAYLCGFAVAYLLMRWLAKRRLILVPEQHVGDALMWLIGGVVVGGRLGYVLVYQRELLWQFGSTPPWWGVLAIHQGGMASHGGIVGVILASVRICRGWKQPDGAVIGRCSVLHVFDVLALICPFGLFFGRIANFINGELLGKIVTPPGTEGPWWSVQYPQELRGWAESSMPPPGHTPPLTPDQKERLLALVHEAAPNAKFPAALERLIETAGRHAEQIKPLLASRHPSQLYQAAAEGLALGIIVWVFWAKPRRPGVVGAIWLMSYGILRVLTELVRLPDPQFVGEAAKPWGLSRGQWLSVAMVVGGIGLLVWSLRQAKPKLGGWLWTNARASGGIPRA